VHHWRNFKIEINPMNIPNPPIMPVQSGCGDLFYADTGEPYVPGVERYRGKNND